jgi:BTB/POZ domain
VSFQQGILFNIDCSGVCVVRADCFLILPDGLDPLLSKKVVSTPMYITPREPTKFSGIAAGGRSSYAWSGFTPVIDVRVKKSRHTLQKLLAQNVGELADFTLEAQQGKGGKKKSVKRKCHRVVLAGASTRFAKMFLTMAAAGQDLPDTYVLTEKCWRVPGVLDAFLAYCYTDAISLPEHIERDDIGVFVDALVDACHAYGVSPLERSLQLYRYLRDQEELDEQSERVFYVEPTLAQRLGPFVGAEEFADVCFVFPPDADDASDVSDDGDQGAGISQRGADSDRGSDSDSDVETVVVGPKHSERDSEAEGGTRKLWAHKCILSARSGHFRALLSGGFSESSQRDINMGEQGVGFGAFRALVHYCYTNEAKIEDDDAVKKDGPGFFIPFSLFSFSIFSPRIISLCCDAQGQADANFYFNLSIPSVAFHRSNCSCSRTATSFLHSLGCASASSRVASTLRTVRCSSRSRTPSKRRSCVSSRCTSRRKTGRASSRRRGSRASRVMCRKC